MYVTTVRASAERSLGVGDREAVAAHGSAVATTTANETTRFTGQKPTLAYPRPRDRRLGCGSARECPLNTLRDRATLRAGAAKKESSHRSCRRTDCHPY